jgi:iron(III) transport system substrate-binding protein
MRRRTNRIHTGILTILTLVLSSLLLCCRQRPSEDRAKVVLYCSVDQAIAEPVIAEFERRSGIEVSARFDTEASKTVGLVQKIRAEAASPIADVFWSSEIFHTMHLGRQGLLAPYDGPATEDWPALFRDPEGRWYGFALRARVIAYNTQRVPPDKAPQTLEGVHYGFERAREILQALKANRVRLVDGNSTAVRMVATGQADVCFTDTDDVYAAQRNGWPVDMNYLDQGGNGPLVIPNTVALIKGAPHPELAKQLMEFLLSERCEQMLAESDSHNAPVHPSLAEQFRMYAISKPLGVDYRKVADQLPIAIKTAGETLR